MLSYWILRSASDVPIGLVRIEDDRVLLETNAFSDCEYRLFSETADVPIMPYAEVRFSNAAALLGCKDGSLCAFAAAPNAAPSLTYLERMSHICTTIEEPSTPQTEPDALQTVIDARKAMPDAPEEESPVIPDISDTARDAEAFAALLKRADAFYERFDRIPLPSDDSMVQKKDNQAVSEPERGIDLFPGAFPGARWRYVEGENLIGHYEGIYRYPNGERIRILAVRGKCAPRPPRTLAGFTRFLRAYDGTGYWLRLLPIR